MTYHVPAPCRDIKWGSQKQKQTKKIVSLPVSMAGLANKDKEKVGRILCLFLKKKNNTHTQTHTLALGLIKPTKAY